jgi:hypothetical protein
MREMTAMEVAQCSGGMSMQCWGEMGLNFIGTGAAIGVTIGTGGLAGVGAVAGSALGWSSWYRDCGPGANYGM